MQDPILIQADHPLCTCGTRPGTPLWEPHIMDLFRLEQQVRKSGDTVLIRVVNALVEGHLAMEG